jgi:hypothetical protein
VSSPRYCCIALRSLLVTTKKGESRDYRAARHGEYEHGNPSLPARLSPPTATMTCVDGVRRVIMLAFAFSTQCHTIAKIKAGESSRIGEKAGTERRVG